MDSKAFCPLFLDNYTRFCEEQRFMCSNGECVRNEEDCEEVLQGNREKNCSLQGFIRFLLVFCVFNKLKGAKTLENVC